MYRSKYTGPVSVSGGTSFPGPQTKSVDSGRTIRIIKNLFLECETKTRSGTFNTSTRIHLDRYYIKKERGEVTRITDGTFHIYSYTMSMVLFSGCSTHHPFLGFVRKRDTHVKGEGTCSDLFRQVF